MKHFKTHVAGIDGDNLHGCLKNNKVDSNIAKYDLLKIATISYSLWSLTKTPAQFSSHHNSISLLCPFTLPLNSA